MAKTRTIAVVGIDGSGKSSIIRRFIELNAQAKGDAMAMTCPTYHETAEAPFGRLSRQLDMFSKSSDALGSFELKAAAMFLQMSLFGPVQEFFVQAYQPQFLLIEHHALIDSLAYGAFYATMIGKPIDQAALEPKVRERIDKVEPGAFDAILRWLAQENRRLGLDVSLWDLPRHVSEIFKQDRGKVVAELQRRYRTAMPDVVLFLDLPVELAMQRLRERGDKGGELHEQVGILQLLRKSYHQLADSLAKESAGSVPYLIDTSSASIDDVLRDVIMKFGIGRAAAQS